MIPEGTDAPGFELPGLVDGEHKRVALDEFVGSDVVLLAFYPADFNPACGDESDLSELDLYTMQKDVEVLAIGPDTLYSHEAFAEAYDLHVPLLADTDYSVAEAYGVDFEDEVGQRLVERAICVVDHDGIVQFCWRTRNLEERPESAAIKDAIAETGGDDTAFARYRVGYAHYTEARRAFTSAMASYRSSEWMMAQSNFRLAREKFEKAADHFDSSVRFVDDEKLATCYGPAQEKATALWQAADWLGESASAYASGSGGEGQQLREDVEGPLTTARDIGEPISPDDWPPDVDEDANADSVLPQSEDSDATLTVDVDETALEETASDTAWDVTDTGEKNDNQETDSSFSTLESIDESTDGTSDDGASTENDPNGDGSDGDKSNSDRSEGESSNDTIDDDELEKIQAELAASQPDKPADDSLEENSTSMVDEPPDASTEADASDGQRATNEDRDTSNEAQDTTDEDATASDTE